jgi:hypothetical protein
MNLLRDNPELAVTMYALACTVNVNDQEIGALVESRMDLLAVAPTQAKPLTIWGPLVFSAITGGTQTQHWRGGGVGSSLISLVFLFTFQTGIVASHF